MAKRIISAIVGISFILLVIFLSHTWHILIDIFMALVCAVAVGEFVHAPGLLKKYAFCDDILSRKALIQRGFGYLWNDDYHIVWLSNSYFNEKP